MEGNEKTPAKKLTERYAVFSASKGANPLLSTRRSAVKRKAESDAAQPEATPAVEKDGNSELVIAQANKRRESGVKRLFDDESVSPQAAKPSETSPNVKDMINPLKKTKRVNSIDQPATAVEGGTVVTAPKRVAPLSKEQSI